jgi:outer membrane lipoprotein-sorting protein
MSGKVLLKSNRMRIISTSSFTALVALLVFLSACSREEAPTSEAVKTPTPNASSSPMPMQWSEMAVAYDKINDYTCLYEKEERAISDGEKQTMKLYFRKPFSFRIEWFGDKGKVDQEAVYQRDVGDDKITARATSGFRAMVGELKIDPNGGNPDSKHPANQLGIGYLIEQIIKQSQKPEVSVRYLGEETLDDGRPAYEFEFVNTSGSLMPIPADARRALVWVDKSMKLPVKLELYDASSALLERHRFKDIKTNVALPDKTFVL